jgi:hypothetical protein
MSNQLAYSASMQGHRQRFTNWVSMVARMGTDVKTGQSQITSISTKYF